MNFGYKFNMIVCVYFVALVQWRVLKLQLISIGRCGHELFLVHNEGFFEIINFELSIDHLEQIIPHILHKVFLEASFNKISNVPVFAEIVCPSTTKLFQLFIMDFKVLLENCPQFRFWIL